jgi:hypothetical protein
VKVKYIGHHDEVEVDYLDTETGQQTTVHFKRNHAVEVPDELANGGEGTGGLLAQEDAWAAVESPKRAADKD